MLELPQIWEKSALWAAAALLLPATRAGNTIVCTDVKNPKHGPYLQHQVWTYTRQTRLYPWVSPVFVRSDMRVRAKEEKAGNVNRCYYTMKYFLRLKSLAAAPFFPFETTAMLTEETSLWPRWHGMAETKLNVFLFLAKSAHHCLFLFPDCHWSDEQPTLLTYFHYENHPYIINIFPNTFKLTFSLLTQLLKMSVCEFCEASFLPTTE